ncbi:hypothetical protein [Streptomyces sp. UNOB3_S3]|uniref:hypothetical protein n=1 Tax=Streptomyces sp. UNOB3_S3 TaxID=2871682 RepID=UPI001E37FE24|nr:hypothetical protein [Streptomyces sp. UNOB3_S3]MCC3777508.1 hypothetical protein [Streptomyces sp. UNOB3_S3]
MPVLRQVGPVGFGVLFGQGVDVAVEKQGDLVRVGLRVFVVAAQAEQQARPSAMSRSTASVDTAGRLAVLVRVPSAVAGRFAASYGLIGSRGIDARTAPASNAYTAARDHSVGDTSGPGRDLPHRLSQGSAARCLEAEPLETEETA